MAPEIRASWPKLVMGHVKRLAPPERQRVWDEIGELRSSVRDTPLLAWLPAAVQVDLSESLMRGLQPVGARDFWHGFMLDAFGRPLLKPLLLGARAVYGGTTLSLLRMAPRVHSLVTRGCGVMEVQGEEADGGGRATLTATDLPVLAARSEGFLLSYSGACHAVFEFTHAVGQVLPVERHPGRVVIELEWRR